MKKTSLIAALLMTTATFGATHAFAADPAMTGPLAANATPVSFDGGPVGKINVGGVLSGLGYTQSNRTSADEASRTDLSNAQIFVQKTDGPVQFYVQAGGYSIPALGTAYVKTADSVDDYFGLVPVAYLKYVADENFSFQVGKLPTLIGAEYTFTFQNMNIQRGLLWNQENAVNKGIQANYSNGPLNASVSLNDGFYSGKYSWLTGLVSYQLDAQNTIAVAAGGNMDSRNRSTLATPLAQNNSEIYNLMYTYTNGALTLSPYLQYTHVAKDTDLGLADDASTTGVALLGKYQFDTNFSLAARAEYIDSSGSTGSSAPNLMYGTGSSAYSFTVTPTYQQGVFFVRGEASYVAADDTTSGSAFGTAGTKDTQARGLIETGIIF